MSIRRPIEFGLTPWGRDWVRRVEPIKITKPEPLLPKARSLVRAGHTTVEVSAGMIAVNVTAAGKQQLVTIAVPEYTSTQRRRIIAFLQRAGAASTASGDLPDDLHSVLSGADLPPVPDSSSMRCGCSAKVDRCLHITAAIYAVGAFIDSSPVWALRLRGITEAAMAESRQEDRADRWMAISDIDMSTYFGETVAP